MEDLKKCDLKGTFFLGDRDLKCKESIKIAKRAEHEGQALGYRLSERDDDRFSHHQPESIFRQLQKAKKEFKHCLNYRLKYVLVPWSEDDCGRQLKAIKKAGLIPVRYNVSLDPHDGMSPKQIMKEAYQKPKHRSVVSYQNSHLKNQGKVACCAKRYAKKQGFCVVPLNKCLQCRRRGDNPWRGEERSRGGSRGGDRWSEEDFDKNDDDFHNKNYSALSEYDDFDSAAASTPRHRSQRKGADKGGFVNGRSDIEDYEESPTDKAAQKAQVRRAHDKKEHEKDDKDKKEKDEAKEKKDDKKEEKKEGKEREGHKHDANEKKDEKEKNGAAVSAKGGFGILIAVIVASVLML